MTEENSVCCENCPLRKELEDEVERQKLNRTKGRVYYVDKGFSYINATICLVFYGVAAANYHKADLPVPLNLTLIVFVSIVACLGVKTQDIAETIGRFLSKAS